MIDESIYPIQYSLNDKISGLYKLIAYLKNNVTSTIEDSCLFYFQLQESGSIATPTFVPPAGTYSTAQDVYIECTTPGVSIYYTIDESDPDESDIPYTGPIHITNPCTIKAKAYKVGWEPSDVAEAHYDGSLPVQLSNFSAGSSKEYGVIISWSTESEIDCQGFHIWKSTDENIGYERISETIIPSQGNSTPHQEYSFNDRKVKDNILYWYKIEEISTNGNSEFYGPISVSGVNPVPDDFALMQNYPNPFNPETTIEFNIPKDTDVKLLIYNLNGKVVKTLLNSFTVAGYYKMTWNGLDDYSTQVSSGVYFLKLITADFSDMRKIMLVR
ncbi:chitobiase/beta-hexosaminidase C-terminal domain-containing protein [candidate division KSB1 bacterium]|nr:chitobiase/beta-hexosaminidase C-terminal domain-containing protein [candidate division KSB1 bacterium]